MTTLLIIVHIIVSLFLIGIVLLQHGKGADIGATFGGSSQSLFGTEGPVPLLNKITTLSAIIFMGTSASLAYISTHKGTGSVMSDVKYEAPAPQEAQAPTTIPLPTGEEGNVTTPAPSATGTEAGPAHDEKAQQVDVPVTAIPAAITSPQEGEGEQQQAEQPTTTKPEEAADQAQATTTQEESVVAPEAEPAEGEKKSN